MTTRNDSLAMVLSTTATAEEAQSIARLLIDERLVACAQISGPMTSVYRWQENTEVSSEYRLVLKTTLVRWPKLRQRLAEVHSYDEPQIILVDIADATDGYRQWVFTETD